MWAELSAVGVARIHLHNEEVVSVEGDMAADRSTYEMFNKNDEMIDAGK